MKPTLFACFIGLLCSAAQAQLLVQRLDGSSVTLDAARLADLPHETVKAESHGKPVQVSGVKLAEVLRAAGIEPPQQIRGAALRQVLMAGARPARWVRQLDSLRLISPP